MYPYTRAYELIIRFRCLEMTRVFLHLQREIAEVRGVIIGLVYDTRTGHVGITCVEEVEMSTETRLQRSDAWVTIRRYARTHAM